MSFLLVLGLHTSNEIRIDKCIFFKAVIPSDIRDKRLIFDSECNDQSMATIRVRNLIIHSDKNGHGDLVNFDKADTFSFGVSSNLSQQKSPTAENKCL